MSLAEEKVRAAFDGVSMPDGLQARVLANIEARREELEGGADSGVTVHGAVVGQDVVFGQPAAVQGQAVAASGQVAAVAPHVAARNQSTERDKAAAAGQGQGSATQVASGVGASPKAKKPFSMWRRVAAAAACFAVAFLGVGGFAVATTPTAYVGVDVNPSFELALNRFDYVVSAQAYNVDGEDVLAVAGVEGMKYEDAVDALRGACADYLQGAAAIEVSIVCDDDARCKALEDSSNRHFAAWRATDGVHCARENAQMHEHARSAGMGMGKYRMYIALTDAGVEISEDECADMSMHDLHALADQHDVDCVGADGGMGSGGHGTDSGGVVEPGEDGTCPGAGASTGGAGRDGGRHGAGSGAEHGAGGGADADAYSGGAGNDDGSDGAAGVGYGAKGQGAGHDHGGSKGNGAGGGSGNGHGAGHE